MTDYLYRFESQRYSILIDADREEYGVTRAQLVVRMFPILKETPQGCWVRDLLGDKKWVSNTTRKRLGHRTKEEAMAAYRERKKSYVKHCDARLKRAKEDLALATPTKGLTL
jgi:hypothetical protein